MTTLRVNSKQFARYHKRLAREFKPTLLRGIRAGAARCIPYLVQRTRKAPPANPAGIGRGGAVNTGEFIRAWRWITLPNGARLLNDRPYGPVIEKGRRRRSKPPPVAAIGAWMRRRLKVRMSTAKGKAGDARRAAFWQRAWAISRAIGRRGLLPRLILTAYYAQKKIAAMVHQEVVAELNREMNKAP